jgi:lipid II:glycine glycyltransferase (peptidoglycan interpeptide bridge formation enzyme)
MPSSLGREARELGSGYSVEVDAVDEAVWYQILAEFDDASIYQTWAYEEARAGRESISHIVLRKDGALLAAAQARIAKLPLLGAGIAYVRWGPMWRSKSRETRGDAFRQAIRALRNEYACRRGLVLRLKPLLFRETSHDFVSILAEEGYATSAEAPDRTISLDLTRTIEDLRNGMRPHWRRYLKVAEKNDLEIVEGSDDALFSQFIPIYRELVGRKAFAEPNDIREFRLAQERLPRDLKLKIMLCKAGGTLCSGLICSAIGNTGIYLYGATSNAGLKSRGSYLLHWRLIEQLKRDGIATYDLHGINPVTNPGTYKFKADLCGSNGADVHFLGRFDSCTSMLSQSCVAVGDGLMGVVRSLKKSAASKPAAANPSAAAVAPGSDI